MKTKVRHIFVSIFAVLYAGTVLGAFILKVDFLLFFLTVPWSVLVSFLSPLLGHMFGAGSLDASLLVGALLNLAIFMRLTIRSSNDTDE